MHVLNNIKQRITFKQQSRSDHISLVIQDSMVRSINSHKFTGCYGVYGVAARATIKRACFMLNFMSYIL